MAAGAAVDAALRAERERVIHLFMAGAPSQLDLFDFKPTWRSTTASPCRPRIVRTALRLHPADASLLASRFQFAKHGQRRGISEVMPRLAGVADEHGMVKSVHTDQFNHAPAQIFFNTGFSQPGRPSMGSWVTYGLGAETRSCRHSS